MYRLDHLQVCFTRNSLPAEQQLSDIPEEREGDVSWFTHDKKGKPLAATREEVSGPGDQVVNGQLAGQEGVPEGLTVQPVAAAAAVSCYDAMASDASTDRVVVPSERPRCWLATQWCLLNLARPHHGLASVPLAEVLLNMQQ